MDIMKRDIAHLRFLSVAVRKGDFVNQEDADFLLRMRSEIRQLDEGITETLEILRGRYKEL